MGSPHFHYGGAVELSNNRPGGVIFFRRDLLRVLLVITLFSKESSMKSVKGKGNPVTGPGGPIG